MLDEPSPDEDKGSAAEQLQNDSEEVRYAIPFLTSAKNIEFFECEMTPVEGFVKHIHPTDHKTV